MKKCPYCAEEIQQDAIKCRYCGEFLPEYETFLESEKIRKKNEQRLESEKIEIAKQNKIKREKQDFRKKQNKINKTHFDDIYKIYKGTKNADIICKVSNDTYEDYEYSLFRDVYEIIQYSFGIGFSQFDFLGDNNIDSAIDSAFSDIFYNPNSCRFIFDSEGRVSKINYSTNVMSRELVETTLKYHPQNKSLDTLDLKTKKSETSIPTKHIQVSFGEVLISPIFIRSLEKEGKEKQNILFENSDYYAKTHQIGIKGDPLRVHYMDSGFCTIYSASPRGSIDYKNEFNDDGTIKRITFLSDFNGVNGIDMKHIITILNQNNRLKTINYTYHERCLDGSWDEQTDDRKESLRRFYSDDKIEKILFNTHKSEVECLLDYYSDGRLKSVNEKIIKLGIFGRKRNMAEITANIKYNN